MLVQPVHDKNKRPGSPNKDKNTISTATTEDNFCVDLLNSYLGLMEEEEEACGHQDCVKSVSPRAVGMSS